MKKLHWMMAIAIAIIGMSLSLYAFPKIPLVERFTGVNCVPCATYNNDYGYAEWAEANRTSAAIITYHWNVPTGAEPLYSYNASMTNTRVDFYGVNSVPRVILNGTDEKQPTVAQMTTWLATESAKDVPMKITPTLEIVDGVATIKVEVYSTAAMNNIRLQVLLLESPVRYTTAPGANGETVFPYVARHAFPDMNGENITIAAEETITKEYTQTLASTLNQERLYVVAFVEEMNTAHNIVQAGMSWDQFPYYVYRPKLEVAWDDRYKSVAHNEEVQHFVQIKNTNAWEIEVKPTISDMVDNWTVVSTDLPESLVLAVDETKQFSYTLKHTGADASVLEHYVDFLCEATDNAISQAGLEVVSSPAAYQTDVIDLTKDVKYLHLFDVAYYDDYTAVSFSQASHFAGKMFAIPLIDYRLFEGNILDSLEYFGMSTDENTLLADVVNENSTIVNKLSSMTKTKMFLSNSGVSFFSLGQNQANFSDGVKSVSQFMSNTFGVEPEIGELFDLNDGYDYSEVNITGVPEDSIAKAYPTITLNGGSLKVAYSGLFKTAQDTAYYVVSDGEQYPVMAKYQSNGTRRVTTSFDFHAIPYTASNSVLFGVANSIVSWLFAPTSIEDGETNLTTKNGLLLSTQPNPVVSTSNLIVKNTNDVPVSAQVYLINAEGKFVTSLYNGMLSVGDNLFTISNSNIATGKYFAVTETNAGKTYMSVVISE